MRKHRLSWMYEETPREEDFLAASPVEVAYPSSAYGVSAEEAPIEEPPVTLEEEMPPDAPPDTPPEEPPAAEPYAVADEPSLAEEPCAVADGPPAAEEPYAAAEGAPATEEVPAESEAVEQTDVPTGSGAQDSNGEGANIAEKLNNQAGEVVLVCTSCMTMILIEYNGRCPYSVKSLMGDKYESYSWLLHTTCRSCVNKHKDKLASRDSFGNECMAAFTTAVLSEEFMKQTRWFEIAESVCRKPTRIVMDKQRRSVGYAKIDVMREESTVNCKVKGLRSGGILGKDDVKSETVDSFMPGGFL
jgi:hypothetical protein